MPAVPPPAASAPPVCLLVTVGAGARGRQADPAQGLANLLRMRNPSRFLLVPSRSREAIQTAERVLTLLSREVRTAFEPWSEAQPFLPIDRHDSMESTRMVVAAAIRAARQRFPDAAIAIHAASGTKPMAAGAVLAALDEGVGLVEFGGSGHSEGAARPGRETRLPFDAARWRAERAASVAAASWDNQFFAAAAATLDTAAACLPADDPLRHRLTALARAAGAIAAKEAFQFAEAETLFREACRLLQADPPGTPPAVQELAAVCRKLAERCGRFKLAQGGKRDAKVQRELLAEMIDNSLRAAQAGRFDEAACRLYRAIEMDLQTRLHEAAPEGFDWHGRLRGRDAPAPLRVPGFLAAIQRTEPPKEFSMEQIVHALHALGDASVGALHQDLSGPRHESTFRQATAPRHASVLAHGSTPVEKADYRNLRRAATRFLGLAVAESSPLPAFDPAWLAAGDSSAGG